MTVWYEDPTILYVKSTDFIPTMEQPLNDRLNSIVRFGILASIFMAITRNNLYFMIIPIVIVMIATYLYKQNYDETDTTTEDNSTESIDACTRPTDNNPFMNALIFDNKERPEACKIDNPIIAEEVQDKFSVNNFRDVTDIYGINGGSPQRFYTNPVTTIDQREYEVYKKFLFNNKERGNTMYAPTCKEEATACRVQYEDVRVKNRH